MGCRVPTGRYRAQTEVVIGRAGGPADERPANLYAGARTVRATLQG
ncbi:hypothetical protein SUDANB6_01978 [Streptomyces sp. enrichment culture]